MPKKNLPDVGERAAEWSAERDLHRLLSRADGRKHAKHHNKDAVRESDHGNGPLQDVEKQLRLRQVPGAESFREPTVDWRRQLACFG